jgi:hypothetical protein
MGYVSTLDAAAFGNDLCPRSFILLAVLGIAARRPAAADDICEVIDDLVGEIWTPERVVISKGIRDLLAIEAVRYSPLKKGMIETTAKGMEVLSLILALPVARPSCTLGQIGYRLKLAFLDFEAPSERRFQIESSIQAYECEIKNCEKRGSHCSSKGAFGRQWSEHEVNRLRRDVEVLKVLASRF